MPFQNRLQYDKQLDIMIPIILCTFLGLVAQIDLLIRVTIFWNLPNQNFNTFIAQFTFTSHDESWENLFIDIHIDRERSDRVNPTPGRSPMSDTLQYVRNQRSHPPAPPEPHEETSCQIGVEISDYTGNKISVGVARPSHALGQSVPCDR